MKTFLIILVSVLAIALVLSIYKKFKHNSTFKKISYFVLYVSEIAIVTTILNVFLFSTPGQTTLDVVKNYLTAYAIYQLIVLVTFRLWDASRIDAKTLIKNTADEMQINAEFKKNVSDDTIKHLEKEISSKNEVAWTKNDKKILEGLLEFAQNYNKDKALIDEFRHEMKQTSRAMDFEIKIYSFSWMTSILLRKIK